MKRVVNYLAIIGLGLTIGACRDKDEENEEETVKPQVEITMDPMYDQQFLSSENVIFTTEEGYRVKLREMKVILTDLRNGNHLLSPAAIYDSKKGRTLLKVNGTSSDFGSLSFNIGVDSVLNHSDPSAFPNDHALNIVNASDMHWSWNPGYIFFKVELIADTLDDGIDNFNHPVTYHVGMDETFRSTQFTGLNWNNAGNSVEQLRLKVDLKRLLQNGNSTVDIKTEFMTHSAPAQLPLSIKLAENFKAALTSY